MINIVYKKPHEEPISMEIENDWEQFQKLVDGYIEVVPANDDKSIVMLINEDGKLKGLDVNVWIENTCIAGNVIFIQQDLNGEFISLTDDMIKSIIKILK